MGAVRSRSRRIAVRCSMEPHLALVAPQDASLHRTPLARTRRCCFGSRLSPLLAQLRSCQQLTRGAPSLRCLRWSRSQEARPHVVAAHLLEPAAAHRRLYSRAGGQPLFCRCDGSWVHSPLSQSTRRSALLDGAALAAAAARMSSLPLRIPAAATTKSHQLALGWSPTACSPLRNRSRWHPPAARRSQSPQLDPLAARTGLVTQRSHAPPAAAKDCLAAAPLVAAVAPKSLTRVAGLSALSPD